MEMGEQKICVLFSEGGGGESDPFRCFSRILIAENLSPTDSTTYCNKLNPHQKKKLPKLYEDGLLETFWAPLY